MSDGPEQSQTSGFPVGQRLKQLRLQLGISQRELARRAEITNGNLSQIEKGVVSPSLATLEKVLQALSIKLEDFFVSPSLGLSAVQRASDLTVINKKCALYKIMPITEARADALYLLQQTLLPGASLNGDWQVHEGVLGAFVVAGELTLRLDGEVSLLLPGDGFHFALHQRFLLQNLGSEPCQLVAVSISWL